MSKKIKWFLVRLEKLLAAVRKYPNRSFLRLLYRLLYNFSQLQFYVEQLPVYTMSDWQYEVT